MLALIHSNQPRLLNHMVSDRILKISRTYATVTSDGAAQPHARAKQLDNKHGNIRVF
ncbi:hypothetical protein PQG02_35680 (plasmid) [Nostoc sp. UHCC 0926]|uniref:hypothetical protein n=1 Tax=Nostoc sp. UHCC 0926 TaxID=3025190 RepID=UPI002362533C|nr:hypothetical protein [Nostoc sp. UHCC 0926]WDD36493.1 hypothetical protein PQG02_35680 [Nostoc sp. UHCC 0926]